MSQEGVVLLLKMLFALVALVVMAVYLLRPMLKMLHTRSDVELMVPDFLSRLEEEELQIPEVEEDHSPDRGTLIQQAKADPTLTAQMVRKWLKERK